MQLKSIKVAGFKSFADPTTIPMQSQITAVVGPNGCGKSNIVDAIRCVLSGVARQLRGGSMPDIIFNGSADRKPVGQASVEMTFDNSDGSIGGEYAQYAEICVRREINRDGQSHYSLNGVRCRRRDVVDIFLGTGLGPDSYAIIEQGMISKLIEAKPDELRVYLEEAAGISKYKERRRETENRIQHTRENLERLNDHRLELEKQLAHLQRQANAAEKFKELKQEERQVKAELQAILWRELAGKITEQNTAINQQENQLEAKIAEQRQADAAIEKMRSEKIEVNDAFNEVQSRFYSMGAELARLEQRVNSTRERQQQLQNDLADLERNHAELLQHHEQDQMQIEELTADLTQLDPELEETKAQAEQAQADLNAIEQAMHRWQQEWDEFNQKASRTLRELEVEQTRVQHHEQVCQRAEQQIAKLSVEQQQFDNSAFENEIAELTQQHQAITAELSACQNKDEQLQQQLQAERQRQTELTRNLNEMHNQLQSMRGRSASLETLQQAALGKNDNHTVGWLQQHQIANNPRLAQQLQVETGWELAVETVLGPYLEAVCVEQLADVAHSTHQLMQGHLTLVQTRNNQASSQAIRAASLANKVSGPQAIKQWLENIFVADDIVSALAQSNNLSAQESIVTRDGVWLGRDWLRITKQVDARAGVLQRERELQELHKAIESNQDAVTEHEQVQAELVRSIADLEQQRNVIQQQYRQITLASSDIQTQLNTKQARLEQLRQRQNEIAEEIAQQQQLLEQTNQALQASKTILTQALKNKAQDEQRREELTNQRETVYAELVSAREMAQTTKRQVDELQMRAESTRNQVQFLEQALVRAEKQIADLNERRSTLTQALNDIATPLEELNTQLAEGLQQRLTVEHELNAARQLLSHVEHALQEQERQRDQTISDIDNLRQQLEQLRMKFQALQIKQMTYQEKIVELAFQLEELLPTIAEEAQTSEWEERLTRLENRIQRLGAINLAAIEECGQLAERKTYLDAQNADLLEALETLETAIRKIDQESRAKLQDTYDKVNEEFNRLFQRVFNGGHAALELTGNDLLDTGVIVRAQPPGKRNSHIHLLSGGEKALTAVALVFAFFHLNPSPFCILDEVDAPLDDLNVGRFCNLVKEMSDKVQFIFISHNKLTIEMAQQLIGVTMHEPGVSRLVAVNIEQALSMATAS